MVMMSVEGRGLRSMGKERFGEDQEPFNSSSFTKQLKGLLFVTRCFHPHPVSSSSITCVHLMDGSLDWYNLLANKIAILSLYEPNENSSITDTRVVMMIPRNVLSPQDHHRFTRVPLMGLTCPLLLVIPSVWNIKINLLVHDKTSASGIHLFFSAMLSKMAPGLALFGVSIIPKRDEKYCRADCCRHKGHYT